MLGGFCLQLAAHLCTSSGRPLAVARLFVLFCVFLPSVFGFSEKGFLFTTPSSLTEEVYENKSCQVIRTVAPWIRPLGWWVLRFLLLDGTPRRKSCPLFLEQIIVVVYDAFLSCTCSGPRGVGDWAAFRFFFGKCKCLGEVRGGFITIDL